MSRDSHKKQPDLKELARRAMIALGFLTETPNSAKLEIEMQAEPHFATLKVRDLSSRLWSSIDNDDSRDLDQIEYAERDGAGTRIYIGIADVDWFVPRQSSIDQVAGHNTTSVYTGVVTFPMLPERLSTDLSSLNEGEKRLAVVVEMLISNDGSTSDCSIYSAIVQNKAQLTYNAVASWLEASVASTSLKIEQNRELQDQLMLQNSAAEALRKARHEAGALSFQTLQMNPVFSSTKKVLTLEERRQNRASLLIEDLMIAANQATARFLDDNHFPSVRRVVKAPERWDRIVSLAASYGYSLPAEPDAKRLEDFLGVQRQANPDQFADLSLAVVKLLGRGEYVANSPGNTTSGHFALAANAYSHSTAPNRRFADLITQRLIKAALSGGRAPYSMEELSAVAVHCTERENAANKVERFVKKCAAAVLLSGRIGEVFEGVITGVTDRGTWVRILHPHVEGKIVERHEGLDVGDRVRVRLASVDAEHGFIDFGFVGSA